MNECKIICGHYGTGKTNLSLNLAFDAAERGDKVTLVDMDIVNPYFRSTDYSFQLQQQGVRIIKPSLAGTTLDSPSLSSEIYSAFEAEGVVIFDVGGDDAGAGALGRFAQNIKNVENCEIIYVINKFRPVTAKPDGAVEILREIEKACKLKATALVNNSHLCTLTTADDILSGYKYACEVSSLCSLPLKFTTVSYELYDEVSDVIPNLYKVRTHVKLPF